ncbi:uncharacterized protein GLRG_02888 [Colletotrichum graminicola M1.001]|uniref:Uncharacterized protein n=1 Tax=Colletotrichum graminicola (strain M1.001 / M2 / FGSC 10212) TaxID=645133 RepID=E3QA56_COLGM|nr:uncharacterized protein GLRG_02888 [Colletotrichum graminicola M1.001]EFQ27744.1 hypothetical protein GLRG_02888 [Colletotrichum graminicola M1.001]
MPALVAICSKGVAKAGKSVFKFQGKDYDVKLDKPLETKVDRGPSKPTSKAPDKPASCKGKRLEARVNLRNRDVTRVITQGPARQEVVRRICYGDTHGQACYHYKSVIDRDNKLSKLTCPGEKIGKALRPVVASYNTQHNTDWSSGWQQQDDLVCQRDEYPPADIWRSRDDKAVWIRLLPQGNNGGAGQLFGGCPENQATELIHEGYHTTENVGCRVVTITTRRVRAVEKVIELKFDRMDKMPADYGIEENPCWPKTLNNNDPGFALLNNDDWYKGAGRAQQRGYRQYYSKEPTDMFTVDANGVAKVSIYKRGEGNTTRQPTEEELLEDFGLVRCRDGSCEKEMHDLGYASLPVSGMKPTSPPETEASTTMAVALPTSLSGVLATAADVAKAAAAVITAAPEAVEGVGAK